MVASLEIIGHDQVLSVLDRTVIEGRVRHAYLFVGPSKVGKAAVSRWLAERLNCPVEPAPCGRCPVCLRIRRGVHPDVRSLQIPGDRDDSVGLPLESLEKASRVTERSIGIDQVRALQHDASLAPSEATWKVYQVLNAELLTLPAANCLLKTLEEPPRNVVLILTATEGVDLLPTLVSRCQVVRFGLVSPVDIAAGLISRLVVDSEKAALLARLAGGRPGWALDAAMDEKMLGERDRAFDDLVAATRPGFRDRLDVAERVAAGYSKDQAAAQHTIAHWQALWWDVHLSQIGCPDLIANVDRQEAIESFARRVPAERVIAFLGDLVEASRRLTQNVNPRLALEALLLNSPAVT